MIDAEYLRSLESSMSKEEISEALAIARANGWGANNMEAPTWVWNMIFHQVISQRRPLA